MILVPAGMVGGGYVLERSPAFCAACHEMRPSVEAWESSGASRNHPDCIGCHSGKGLAGLLESEVRGLRMIGIHFFADRDPDRPIKAKMPETFCLKCHSEEDLVASHAMFKVERRTCADCHKHKPGWDFSGEMEAPL